MFRSDCPSRPRRQCRVGRTRRELVPIIVIPRPTFRAAFKHPAAHICTQGTISLQCTLRRPIHQIINATTLRFFTTRDHRRSSKPLLRTLPSSSGRIIILADRLNLAEREEARPPKSSHDHSIRLLRPQVRSTKCLPVKTIPFSYSMLHAYTFVIISSNIFCTIPYPLECSFGHSFIRTYRSMTSSILCSRYCISSSYPVDLESDRDICKPITMYSNPLIKISHPTSRTDWHPYV